jgi:hypothetical protein
MKRITVDRVFDAAVRRVPALAARTSTNPRGPTDGALEAAGLP